MMVNMLHLVIDQRDCDDEENKGKPLQLWGIEHQPLGKVKDRHKVQNKSPLSDDENTSNASNDSNAMM